jgi:dienelactone hydrolase
MAAPVAPRSAVAELERDADEVVLLHKSDAFWAIGQFYDDFHQVTDEEVVDLLWRASAPSAEPAIAEKALDPPLLDTDVEVRAGGVTLRGHITIPESPHGIVVFAHGSGSSRHSPRNRYVASVLNQAGLGTMLFDLLTADEETNRANVFDIGLLASRLTNVTQWVRSVPEARGLSVGYFGASTGTGAALLAAVDPASRPAAIVSRGGRPDLAASCLGQVRVPTLLVVGELDDVVIEVNRRAQEQLRCETRLDIVPGATHLFEEPGALRCVAQLARDWFLQHCDAQPVRVGPGSESRT